MQDFKENILNVAKNPTKHFSPTIALINASGSGKTRLIFKLGEKVFVVYVCLRDFGEFEGYPYRSEIATHLLAPMTIREAVFTFKQFITAAMEVIDDKLAQHKRDGASFTPADFIQWQLESSGRNPPICGAEFNKAVQAKLKKGQPKRKLDHLEKEPMVVFAFDEARKLAEKKVEDSDLYREYRRALRALCSDQKPDQTPKLAAVVTDTHGSLRHIAAAWHVSASYRPKGSNDDLPRPYWTVPGWRRACLQWPPNDSDSMDTVQVDSPKDKDFEYMDTSESGDKSNGSDALVPDDEWESLLDGILLQNGQQPPLDDLLNFAETLYSYGRPLWRTFLKSMADETRVNQVVEMARIKLGRTRIDATAEQLPSGASLAVLNARLGLSISGCSIIASDQVAEHMSVCLYIPVNREYIVTGFPVEPVIGNAAHFWMDKLTADRQVKILSEALFEGLVAKGPRGELSSQLLLTWAFDLTLKSCLKSWNTLENITFADVIPVKVETYLETLYGKEFVGTLKESVKDDHERSKHLEELLAGYVRIVQWVRLETDVDNLCAKRCFTFGVACKTRQFAKGNDKLIPIRLKSDKYSWIIVEDKNNEGEDKDASEFLYHSSWTSVMSQAPDCPYLMIYHQMGEVKQSPSVHSAHKGFMKLRSGAGAQENQFQFAVTVFGISTTTFPFLEQLLPGRVDELIELLTLLRDGSFRAGKGDVTKNAVSYWSDVTMKHQQLHDIKY